MARACVWEAGNCLGVDAVAGIGDQRHQRRHVARRPEPLHQRSRAGRRRRWMEPDDFVDIGDGDGEADLQCAPSRALLSRNLVRG